jgi:hypothetical protein
MEPSTRSNSQHVTALPSQLAGTWPITPPYHRRMHYTLMFGNTVFIKPFTTTAKLIFRVFKLASWDVSNAVILKILGYHETAITSLQEKYINTARVARDALFIPSCVLSAFNDMIAKGDEFVGDLPVRGPQSYLNTIYNKRFNVFSSDMHGRKSFEVIQPCGIQEFAAESDGGLKTVMASHFLKSGLMAINFGIPNVATFITEAKEDDSVQTIKIDAKSLKRDNMVYHPTNGKIQSGIFFVPTNLPLEALDRFKNAAQKLEGRADITCVNTNCRVLKEAGFSIEGRELSDVILPTTMMEHLLFRNFIYKDMDGKKHKVHFDIINTTQQNLEEHFEKIDIAVVSTRLRHRMRNADTDENRKARGAAARALIEVERSRLEEEKKLLKSSPSEQAVLDLAKRKITISVPSYIANVFARIWGRHTLYEVDFSDKEEQIVAAFAGQTKLPPFPQKKINFVTRLKRDFFFSQPMINFLRRHMMGHADNILVSTQDLFNYLRATDGEHLNYVILKDRVILAMINVNRNREGIHRQTADWALSKHALLAAREEVYCSGELWYDPEKQRYVINKDSGTYMPREEHVRIAAALANQIFETHLHGNRFEVAEATA